MKLQCLTNSHSRRWNALSKTYERSPHLWWQGNGLQWRFSSCVNEVDACFKASKLWEHVQVMHLSTNMRVYLRADTLAGKSADVLLKNGYESIPNSSAVDYIQIPPESGNY